MQKSITISCQSSLGFLTPQPMLARDFRRQLSKWLTSQPEILAALPTLPSIFQRTSDGKRLNTASPFRFESHIQHQWLHGIGPDASKLIDQLAQLVKGLEPALPCALRAPSIKQSSISLKKYAKARTYVASQLVVSKNAEQFEHWQASSDYDKLQRVLQVIQKGLRSQASSLGNHTVSELLTPADAHIQFEWTEPKLQSIASKAYIRIVTATFTLPCELTGSWAAGPLINKGYGNIAPV